MPPPLPGPLPSHPWKVLMSVSAIIMLAIAIATVWGGLAAAVVNIVRHPEELD